MKYWKSIKMFCHELNSRSIQSRSIRSFLLSMILEWKRKGHQPSTKLFQTLTIYYSMK